MCQRGQVRWLSRAIQSVRLTGELSAEIAAFSGHRGVAGKRTDGSPVPLILSKSAFTGHETLMLIRRIPAYSVPIAEVLQRRTRGHFSTGSPARERNLQPEGDSAAAQS